MSGASQCFRPLTGKLVLIQNEVRRTFRKYEKFPSPYGEVGFDRLVKAGHILDVPVLFPSPYGEVGFDRMPSQRKNIGMDAFPSPYGEVGFDQYNQDKGRDKERKQFPSPYGEVGFDLMPLQRQRNGMVVSFRPLTGKLVLITTCAINGYKEYFESFPSPYGEVGFDPLSPRILIFRHSQRLLRCG